MTHTKKTWNELTPVQKTALMNLMDFHKVPKEKQTKLVYQIYENGTVKGYLF